MYKIVHFLDADLFLVVDYKSTFCVKTATDLYIAFMTSLNQEFCHLISTRWDGYYLGIVKVFIK